MPMFLSSRWPGLLPASPQLASPKVKKKSARAFSSWPNEYEFSDLDGTLPQRGIHARKEHGKHKISDERFYSYWVPGLVELIFPDWF